MEEKEGLNFFIQETKNPYDETGTLNLWVELCIANLAEEKILFYHQWNLVPFLDWFIEVNSDWDADISILEIPMYSSIAESISRAFEHLDEDVTLSEKEEQLADDIHLFRAKHSFRFALRGADIPEIFIGKMNGIGQLSYYDVNSPMRSWSYAIDINQFKQNLSEKLHCLVKDKTAYVSWSNKLAVIGNLPVS